MTPKNNAMNATASAVSQDGINGTLHRDGEPAVATIFDAQHGHGKMATPSNPQQSTGGTKIQAAVQSAERAFKAAVQVGQTSVEAAASVAKNATPAVSSSHDHSPAPAKDVHSSSASANTSSPVGQPSVSAIDDHLKAAYQSVRDQYDRSVRQIQA